MNYNLDDIKIELINNIKDIFDKSTNPTYRDFSVDFNFERGLDVFFKVVIYKCGINKLDGLTKTIIPTLYEAYLSNRGDLKPLKTLSTELEAYLKKIVYIISNNREDYSEDPSKTMIPLFNRLSLTSNQLTKLYLDTNSSHLHGQDEFIEFLHQAYIVRNQVHVSPNWKLSQIANHLESVLIAYLYPTFKYYDILSLKVADIILPSVVEKENIAINIQPTTQALYDFISFNTGTSKIRTQIITAFILHKLNGNGGKMSLDDIKTVCNNQFNTNTELSFYKNIIQELSKNDSQKVIVSGVYRDEITLSELENRRINKVIEQFYFQEQVFTLEINEVLKTYQLEGNTPEIINHLRELFESNYNIDLYEIFDKGFESVDNSKNVIAFIEFIKTIVPPELDAENLFRELIVVCEGNDFLPRLTAGQVFAKIMNPTQIQEYINQKVRIIYLDANVLLHALCYYYTDDEEYKDYYYQATKELIKFADRHSNVNLKTSSLYVYEVAYQLKEALLLIPFEELGLFKKIGGSNNVFYKFYIALKSFNNLDEDVKNFSDFMYGFELTEDNLYDRNFLQNTSQIVCALLYEIGIDVVEIPIYQTEDTFELVKNALLMEGKIKGVEQIKNDTIMLTFLADKNSHENEPTFSTWDNTFFPIRKKYINKNRNSKMWHLFTPSKILTHLQLLEFKIDSKSIAHDFLTIIDDYEFSR